MKYNIKELLNNLKTMNRSNYIDIPMLADRIVRENDLRISKNKNMRKLIEHNNRTGYIEAYKLAHPTEEMYEILSFDDRKS